MRRPRGGTPPGKTRASGSVMTRASRTSGGAEPTPTHSQSFSFPPSELHSFFCSPLARLAGLLPGVRAPRDLAAPAPRCLRKELEVPRREHALGAAGGEGDGAGKPGEVRALHRLDEVAGGGAKGMVCQEHAVREQHRIPRKHP